jgi:SulP family sulfate permease
MRAVVEGHGSHTRRLERADRRAPIAMTEVRNGSRIPSIATALRSVFREGYGFAAFRSDVLAGLVVGIVALPLSMALAIASGVPPQHGLYTAIVAGAVIAALGGSRVQVSGPTAAFVVILVPIVARFGLGGLMLASAMAGVLLIVLGFARLGRLIQFVPYPVTTGFTAGIAVVIAVGQVKDFLGLQLVSPEHFHERVAALASSLDTFRGADVGIGIATLVLLLWIPRWVERVPAPLLAVGGTAVAAYVAHRIWPQFDPATIASRFAYVDAGRDVAGIPPWAPMFELPWNQPGADGQPIGVSFTLLKELFPSAVVIAALGALESLLSAVASDAMAGTRHDPDAELIAQGTGNLLAPFFGGFAATGAIARTATNLRAGARSPIAAIVHAGFLLFAMVAMAPLLGELPLASMAAMLLLVAWRMSDVTHFAHVLRVAPRSDTVVLLTCFALTVFFDMVVGVTVGFVLAAILFMRRMAELSGTNLVTPEHPQLRGQIPDGVLVYEVEGPLFFGAAQKALRALQSIGTHTRAVVLDLERVPTIDATGLVNLESVLARMRHARIPVVLTGVRPTLRRALERAAIHADDAWLAHEATLADGVARAGQPPAGERSR